MPNTSPSKPTHDRSPEPPVPAHRRSDAVRNIDAIRDAAKEVFAHSGVNAPAKEITDRAGLGVGTLYRHFPKRSDLIIAVLQQEIDQCVEAAAELQHHDEPWEAVARWTEHYVQLVMTKTGLASALHSGDPAYENLPEKLLAGIEPAFQALLSRALRAGYSREDVSAHEILITIALICHPVPNHTEEFNQRMIRVYLDGLSRSKH